MTAKLRPWFRAVVGVLSAARGYAQPAPQAVTFEIASIKPANPNNGSISINFVPGGGLNTTNVSLRTLIKIAYQVQCESGCDDFITGGPGWIDSQRFDIQAKAPQTDEDLSHLTPKQRAKHREQLVRLRLQALLAQRFHLVLRKETKEAPMYALVVGKNGHKLKEENGRGSGGGGMGELFGESETMEAFVNDLAGVIGRQVVDRTGLTGRYTYKLKWTPDMRGPGGIIEKQAAAASDPDGPSLFTAIQEQLGLKLEAIKGPVDSYVVVRAEKPSEN
ncbi:MAG TPA: TIGR03435 family protein [Candidatus Solibacter sp.]|nr:TIGR03435 family protein [Candidatus Solibacter sp.]